MSMLRLSAVVKISNSLKQVYLCGGFSFKVSVFRSFPSTRLVGELSGAPEKVRKHLLDIPAAHQIMLADSPEAETLAEAYLSHGIVGPGSRSDALHVALATMGRVDVLVSWNFKHIVNLGRIRLFNAVNLELGYGLIEIRTPKEVVPDEKTL